MLNHNLIENQTHQAAYQQPETQVGDTGIKVENAANACREQVRKETLQRLGRRHNRALFAANRTTGWSARLW